MRILRQDVPADRGRRRQRAQVDTSRRVLGEESVFLAGTQGVGGNHSSFVLGVKGEVLELIGDRCRRFYSYRSAADIFVIVGVVA